MRHLLSLALLIVMLAGEARADMHLAPERNFSVLLVCGGEVRCNKAVDAFRISAALFKKEFNVNLRIQKLLIIREDMSGGVMEMTFKWALRISQKIVGKTPDITLLLLSETPSLDVIDFEDAGILGYAVSGIGSAGTRPAFAWSKITGSVLHASKTITHELGHLFGASHTEAGLMLPDDTRGQHTDSFSNLSTDQIKAHLATLPQK